MSSAPAASFSPVKRGPANPNALPPPGGEAVAVHPGLQGDVPAVTRGGAEERVGCLRGPQPHGGQRHRAAAPEGVRVRIQSPPLFQRIPGDRQRRQDWQDL